MPTLEFHPSLDHARRVFAAGFIGSVLEAVDPQRALKRHFDSQSFTRKTHILSFGKASIEMTNAAIECLGDRFARATVLATHEHIARTQFKGQHIDLFTADHPLPTERSVNATQRLIDHARSITSDHQALVLISGGGSSMLCAPARGVSVEQIAQTTQSMLKAGASIQEINHTRAQLDTIKAGGLAEHLGRCAQVDAYVLADVIEPDRQALIRTIASGPVSIESIPHTIIADNQTALDAACAWIAHEHIELVHLDRQITGSATQCAQHLASKLLASPPSPPSPGPIAGCLGGEPTVDTQGQMGKGGPMLELALAAACELARSEFRWTILTFATDGIDGPTDAAGAIITDDMLSDVPIEDLRLALESHDALTMCDRLGGTIRTGPTGTNVNDVALVIRWEDG